jgi:hypothetical protein
MKPRCPACLKHIACALMALAVLLLSLEAGLRIYDGRTGRVTGRPESISPLLVPSSTTFHRLKPLVAVEFPHPDTGRTVRVTTNSLGLRGPEIAVPKPDGVYRVLVLGDDSTFAAETSLEETACAKLQELLNGKRKAVGGRRSRVRTVEGPEESHHSPLTTHHSPLTTHVEVINAGVPDYCPLLSYLLLKHSLLSLQPDLIVLNFDMTDVADDHRDRRYARMGPDGEPLVCRHPDFEADGDRVNRNRNCCLLRVWAQRQVGRLTAAQPQAGDVDDISSPLGRYAWVKDRPPNWSIYISQAFASIDAVHALARRAGAEFVVAAVPAPWQVSAQASNAPAVREAAGIPLSAACLSNRPFELLQAHLDARGVPLCNPVAGFRVFPKAERLYLANSPQFSPVGQELFARELARTILSTRQPRNRPPSSTGSIPATTASRKREFPARGQLERDRLRGR